MKIVEKGKPPPVLRAGASDRVPGACLHREAQAHVQPRQHAELGRVRVAERQALAGQRLESDPELETAVQRLPAIPDERGAQGHHSGTRRREGAAAPRSRRVDARCAAAQLEDVVPAPQSEVAEDHRDREDGRGRAARAGRGRERDVAHADAQAEVVLHHALIVQRIEQARATAFDEDGVVRGALVGGDPVARPIGQRWCGEGRHGEHDCESKEPLHHLPPPIQTLQDNVRVRPGRQSSAAGTPAWRIHGKGRSALDLLRRRVAIPARRWVDLARCFLGAACPTPQNESVSGNGPADPSSPKGPKKTGIGLQVKLPCATLDEVRARHPELGSRLFLLRTANPRPVATAIRLTATLSDGKHCFRANAVVEKVIQPGEPAERGGPGMSLWLARMDDPGRELIAWMGGQPPPLLKPTAADGSAEAAKASPAKTAPPPEPAADKPAPVAPASSAAKPAAAARSPAPPATPVAKSTPAAPKQTIIEEDFDVTLEDLEPVPAAPIPAAPAAPIPAAPVASIRAASPAPAPAASAPEVPSRAPATSRPVESKRPAPPPLPRPTLAPGAAPSQPPGQPGGESDELPQARTGTPTGPVIGIDLGTTNSCAAVVKDGKPFVIPSREGYNTIPSVVALSDKGKLMVGHPAKSQLLINPRNTVYGAKRLIGRQFKSPAVTDLLGRFSYEVVAGPRGEAAVSMGGQIL